MASKLTRRSFLQATPFGLAAQTKKAKPLPSVGEFTRLIDPVTENQIVRLTSPVHTSLLPDLGNPFVSVRERTLLFSSNRTGHLEPFLLDLRTGALRQLIHVENLQARSLCFDRLQKSAYYLNGDSVREVSFAKGNARTVADGITWFRQSTIGTLFAIQAGKLVVLDGTSPRILTESADACWPQPGGAGCLFARKLSDTESEFWYIAATKPAKPILLASGRIRDPFWDFDSPSILFLRDVTNVNAVVLSEIHRCTLTGEQETRVAATSQFATFSPSGDCTVFIGASRSHAQPNVILMLRTPSRDLTLCQHAARNPYNVLPAFSPDSRRVYFESDHEGNSALYSVNVEYLVEPLATG